MKGHLCDLLKVAALASSATATRNFQTPSSSSYIKKEDLPITGNEWVSLDPNIEFLAAANVPLRNFGHPPRRRNLEQYEAEQDQEEEVEDSTQYRVQPFVEGVSDYDEIQQAWRLLGFMIDCDDKYSAADDDNYGKGCSRYVLWAAVRTIPKYDSYTRLCIDSMSHMLSSFISLSTLTWSTKTEELGNINSGIAIVRNGTRRLVSTTPMVLDRDAPRWIVI
jgi:hypothetical protein